ncbi:hypothetical protein PHYSODRAFT_491495, partial [Phytophthora sojae]
LITSCQNFDVNFESRSETIDFGTPCLFCCYRRVRGNELSTLRQPVHNNHNGVFSGCRLR